MKKILFLSSGDTFGAYEFVYRMAKFMQDHYHVVLAVREKRKPDNWILRFPVTTHPKTLLTRAQNYLIRNARIKKDVFQTDPSYCFLPGESETLHPVKADIILEYLPFTPEIVIAGMTDGFVNTTTLFEIHRKTGAEIYQLMADMNPLTGGCHVVNGCTGFVRDCALCPAVKSNSFRNFPEINFRIKRKNILEGQFKLLVVPGWTCHQAEISGLYRDNYKLISCSVIDTDVFTNTKRGIARQVFDIEKDAFVIFCGSNNAKDPRKGKSYLVEALDYLWNDLSDLYRKNTIILLAGNHNTEDELTARIKFSKKLIPFMTDDRLLSLAYQTSDVFVNPSIEDAGPMMVAEALACGTVVVGFETGILYDDSLIKSEINGFRVKLQDSYELAIALKKINCLNKTDLKKISENARETAEKMLSKESFLDSISNILNNE